MNLILAILLVILFIFLIIFSFYKILICEPLLNIGDDFGRNHCGIVTFHCSCGDIHFDEMSEEEIYNRLKFDYSVFHRFTRPFNKSHLAEYRIFTKSGKVKIIGYITKDRVVFEGKEYIFDKEEENDS